MNKRKQIKTVLFSLAIMCATAAVCQAQSSNEVRIDFDPANTKVEYTLGDVLHTVHGSFRLKSGTIHFDPSSGTAGGLLVVDAASGDSGNKTRDHKMNKEILETDRFPDATFIPRQVIGHLAVQGASQVQVQGTFRLHGADHEVTLSVPAQVNGDQIHIQTQLDIPFVRWGMKDPSTFVLRVNKDIQLSITGTEKISQ